VTASFTPQVPLETTAVTRLQRPLEVAVYDFDHTYQLSVAIFISALKLCPTALLESTCVVHSRPLRTADPGLAVPAPFALAEAEDSI